MYLVFDVGTTSMKTAVFDKEFRPVYSVSHEYQLLYPQKNWVELPAEYYWHALKAGIASALQAGIDPSEVESITITTQGETLIPVDEAGEALANAIVWLDARAEEEAAELNCAIDRKQFFCTTGLSDLSGAVPIAKLMWIKKKQPEIYLKTKKFLLLEDYLIYRLTGTFVSEYSLLSSTGYFDINKNQYWGELLELAEIDKEKLPCPVPCAQVVGRLTVQASEETTLFAGTPVTTGAMDQVAGAVGAGNHKPGIVTETTGTCLVLAATVPSPNYDAAYGSFSIYKHYDENYLYVPFNPTAAIILKWFKDTFLPEISKSCNDNNIPVYQEMDRMAMRSPAGANGLILIPHFSGKLVPEINEKAKGVFYGIGLDNTRDDFIRAVLEGIAYMLRENMECLKRAGIQLDTILSLGGGSRSDIWMQIKADVCGKSFLRTSQSEAGSLGAAMLGALAIRNYDSLEEIREKHKTDIQQFDCCNANHEVYNQAYMKYQQLYQALVPVF